MGKSILDEAQRCLQCKRPLCREGCPISTDVPGMIKLLLEGNIQESGENLFKNNPLSVVCSLVCHHESQCEGSCILGRKSSPIRIGEIENYISDFCLDSMELKPKEKLEGNIGVIGSGPAGITMAFMLALKGYDITIFEGHDKIGGVLRYGIPEFRLPNSVIERLKVQLLKLGVKIRPNTMVGTVLTIEELFRDGYDAVFIGTGVWKPKKIGIKGESLGNVHYAIDYLKTPEVYDLGNKICVVGAGNVAMDVARTALRRGVKEVYIMYRKGFENMSASEQEIHCAKMDGVKFEIYKQPLEFTKEGVIYINSEKVDNDEEIEPEQELFPCDSIIVAVSQGPRSNIVDTSKGIELKNNGLIAADESGRTTREGVFASGDVVTGAKTVVEAVKYTKDVSDVIHEYVQNKRRESKS